MNACQNWTGSLTPDGYGRIGKGLAHRIAYAASNGPIPQGMTVDHLCFNPACVNPEHLRLLTNQENARNQRSASKTHCSSGHELTPENTYSRRPKPHGGRRDCRACGRDRAARYRARRAA